VNWLAFVLASVAAMGLGMVWYSPGVFFRKWQRAIGLTDEQFQAANPGKAMIAGLVANSLSLYFFGVLLNLTGISSIPGGIGLALLVGLGLITLTEINNGSFRGTKPAAYLIDGGYRVLALTLAAVLYGLF